MHIHLKIMHIEPSPVKEPLLYVRGRYPRASGCPPRPDGD